ncbi:MAG: CAAX prenyl protease-related protein [Bryobacteraceae bacterium]
MLKTAAATSVEKYPSVSYLAPFVAFLLFLAVSGRHFINPYWEAPLWVLALAVICFWAWPRELSPRPVRPLASLAVGILVFAIWIAPDLLIPGYRNAPAFSNAITGKLHSSLQPAELQSQWILFWRTLRAIAIVPIVEELFWRAWLMRWLINSDFQKVRLGTYAPLAFWATAILFASEHGPYWDVGLITGIIYNLWMIRTRSVADCILMHAVTNALLSGYVIAASQWQYWQ